VYKFITKDSKLIVIIHGEFIAMQILAATYFERGPQHGNSSDTVADKKEHRLLAKGNRKAHPAV
jgi:hypothetical protein